MRTLIGKILYKRKLKRFKTPEEFRKEMSEIEETHRVTMTRYKKDKEA